MNERVDDQRLGRLSYGDLSENRQHCFWLLKWEGSGLTFCLI